MLKEWGPREGSADAALTEGQIKEKLADYDKQIHAIEDSYRSIEQNSGDNSILQTKSILDDDDEQAVNPAEDPIAKAAAEHAVWKAGYESAEEAEEFSLGSFFDDDDYT